MKSICALAIVLVIVGAEKRSDFGIFGGQSESGFLPIVGHHDDQNIKSFSITKKIPLSFPMNFEKKVTLEKPHQVFASRPHRACAEKKLPQPITVEKHVLVPVKIPIMKPYPIYVEKKIPYFVYRPYPMHMDKPLAYHLKEENQFTYPVEKPSSLPVNNHVPHQTDGASTSSFQFKVPQEGLFTGEGHKTQAVLKEGVEDSEYIFGDYFSKGLQQEASGGNIPDQIGKHLGTRELSTSYKQFYI